MSFESMTDEMIAAEVCQRIEQLRLERNLTQQQVADEIGISRVSYGKLESGEAKFVNIIAALRALGQLALVEDFIPGAAFSPIELLKMKGRQRQRAAGKRGNDGADASVTSQSKDVNVGLNDELDW
ncbi:MAG: hypothetical protein COA99_08970 [Moraxellaceae bacterium]|nr:MAG: hypothetical protein COA99_08970 [Moraxellaceae bacterium]